MKPAVLNEQRDVWRSISKACDIKKDFHIVEFSNEREVIGSTEKTKKKILQHWY